MKKVVKFGGSSLANAEQFKKVGAIITEDESRRYVVPSAPGKRFSSDIKVTDMLYSCYESAVNGNDFSEQLSQIKERYQEIIDGLDSSPHVAQMLSDGSLAVLNIYIDSDLAEWRKYMPIYPDSWYNGYDPDFVIRTVVLYNVRAIPSLYLLDRDKTVLMKDVPQEKLFYWLQNIPLCLSGCIRQ